MITPDHSRGAALIVHGYGGSKEEQMGLAWRIAEAGITSIVLDLRGHGENHLPLDDGIFVDLEAAIEYGKRYGKVTTMGYSLGGRLALLSQSDYTIAISPALNQEYSETTQKILKNLRSYRVKENSSSKVFEILKNLPTWHPDKDHKPLVLYGTRDVPEIIEACRELKAMGVQVREIDNALHGDIFLLEATFRLIANQLKEWYPGR